MKAKQRKSINFYLTNFYLIHALFNNNFFKTKAN